MINYVIRRVLYSIPVLFAASLLIFFSVSAIGNPLATLKINPLVSKETIQNIEKRNHLNDPIIVQYGYWLKTAVTDKFGSPLLQPGAKIWNDLKRVIPHTLQLILLSEIFALIVGISVGVYSATRQYSFFDYTATTLSFLGFAMPVFWLALMLQILFTNIFLKWHVRIFYTSGLSSENPGSGIHFVIDRLQHLALPAMTLTILSIAQYSRFMRASMLEVVNSDYVRTARAKGLKESRVTLRHALRNALIPLVTVAALNFGALIGGAVITESIFQLDGMGPYFLQNLFNQDAYAIMAWLMVTATAVILFNLIADVLYGYIDPRIRYD
jgi:ABC-type dipeptide/oligopeptide/nickel transport system permease component